MNRRTIAAIAALLAIGSYVFISVLLSSMPTDKDTEDVAKPSLPSPQEFLEDESPPEARPEPALPQFRLRLLVRFPSEIEI